jgi:hypothetical protein
MRRGDLAAWGDSTLTDAILGCSAVPENWEFGDETLRRFLKNAPQPPGQQMVRAIVIFLLDRKWITRTDIAAHDKDPALRAGIALQSFLVSDPGAKTLEFHKELSGSYVRYAVLPGRFLRTVLQISAHKDPPVLRVSQRENEYRTSAAERILRETLGLRPELFSKMEKLLRAHAQEVGSTRYSFGFAVAGVSAIAAVLRNELSGATTAYLVDSIEFGDSEDSMVKFNAVRYTGWGAAAGPPDPAFSMRRIPGDFAELAGQMFAPDRETI